MKPAIQERDCTTSCFCTFFDSNYGYVRYLGLWCQRPVYGKVPLQSIFWDKVPGTGTCYQVWWFSSL